MRFKDWKNKLAVPSENKKVKNATKVEYEGIKFDSKLELYFYQSLKAAKVPFELKKKFVLQEKFKYGKESIREIAIIPDFWLPQYNMVIDTKGWAMSDVKIKIKMLKKHLIENYPNSEVIILKNRKDCDNFINRYKYELLLNSNSN